MTESSNNDSPVQAGSSRPPHLPATPEASLARSTAGMASGTIVSRILGMVRASMALAVVGTLAAGDAWDVANTLPNIVYLLLAGGVINAVLVPQITRAANHADGGREYVDRLLTVSITALAVITVVFTLAAGLLVRLYSSPTWEADTRSLSITFAFICMPQIFFYGLYTLLGNVLNARNHFAAYMWAPVLANIVAIGGMAFFLVTYPQQAEPVSWMSPMIWVLAGSATAGIVAQALVLIVPLWRSGFRYTPRWGFRGVGLRTASTVALWAFAALGVSTVGFIITSQVTTYAGQAGALASLDVPGKISYSNAFLIFMLPHSLVTVSLVTALFTRMSRSAGTGSLDEVRDDVDRGMRLTAVATVPATVGAFVLGFAATATLYYGNSAAQTRGIATVMMAMMVGLVPFGILFLLQRTFYAFEDAKTPFILTVVVTVIATLANLASLLLPLRWIVVGVGAGQALSNFAGMALGLVLVRRRLGGLPLRIVTRTYVRLGIASVVGAAATYLVLLVLGLVIHGRLYSPVALAVGGLVFAGIYVAAARRLQVREIDDLVGPIVARARAVLPRSLARPSMKAHGMAVNRNAYERQTGAGVRGVGPGTVTGGRYTLQHRLTQDHDLERWSAHDATLERDVTLTIIGAEHPNRAGLLDAARRAAGVADTRLVRILDVGTGSDSSFIVEEALTGSESLATILLQGPLHAEEARRIAGETAQGLESARQRGLHHLRLTPHSVLIAPDGAIRVSGVAVAAATLGPEMQELDPATASRRDALCLVAVVYAALTGRWPLAERVPGIEPAPKVVDGVAAPSELVAGVPNDLDSLCRIALNEAAGPLTPGDLANRLAPWSRERVHRAEVDPTAALRLPGHELGDDGSAPSPADMTQLYVTEPAKTEPARTEPARELGTAPASPGTEAGAFSAMASSAGESTSATESGGDNEDSDLPEGFSSRLEDAVPPLSSLPASTARTPSRGQSKIVLLVVLIFVGLALYVGARGLLGTGESTSASKSTPKSSVAASVPRAKVSATPAPKAGSGPIAILSATGFDPEGDNTEGNSKAGRVYDGNLATAWTSELYTNAQFGNLKKGVGVLLDLGQPTSVHQVTIDLGAGPVDVTAYAATDSSLQGATAIGTASGASGRVQLKATHAMPETQYVIVWFTTLAPDGGQFRASVSEIALS